MNLQRFVIFLGRIPIVEQVPIDEPKQNVIFVPDLHRMSLGKWRHEKKKHFAQAETFFAKSLDLLS